MRRNRPYNVFIVSVLPPPRTCAFTADVFLRITLAHKFLNKYSRCAQSTRGTEFSLRIIKKYYKK